MTRSRFWFIVTLLLATVTGLLVYRYLTGVQRAAVDEVMTAQVVAKVKIPAGTRIAADMVETEQVPVKYAHPSVATGVGQVTGQFALIDLLTGEPVPLNRLASEKTLNELPYKIPAGMRAVTIPVNSLTGVAGLVKPGHYVDVLATYRTADKAEDLKVVTVLQDVLVLAVGSDLQKKEGVQAVENVTLAVTPGDAQVVALAENLGKLKLAARPAGDDSRANLPYADVMRLMKLYP